MSPPPRPAPSPRPRIAAIERRLEHHKPPAAGPEHEAVRRDAPQKAPPGRRPRIGRRLGTTALLVGSVVALLASVPGLHGVFDSVGRISPVWILVAIALELASDISFVVVFRLFFDRLGTRDARLLAWAEQGSGALLPGGGAGGLAIGGWLIHMTGVPLRWIVRRSAGLFFLSAAVSSAALVGGGVAGDLRRLARELGPARTTPEDPWRRESR
jgi:hypothetical protein